MPSRRVILILGMHRSGTCAVARAVYLQGAALPKTLMPARPDNPDGFWESLPITQFNDKLLQEAGRSWDDPRPIDRASWRKAGKRLHRIDEARELLQREFPDGELIVLKDPRISLLSFIWLASCQDAGMAASAFLCCRNPLEVAASLTKRDGMDSRRSHLLWLGHMLEAEQGTRGLPRAVVQFDSLLSDWRHALSHAYDALGMDSLAFTGEAAEAVDRFLSPDKRHHLATTDQILRDEHLSPLLKEAWWTAFQKRPLPSEKTFDRLRDRLADAWATVAPGGTLSSAAIATGANMQTPMTSNPQGTAKQTAESHRHVVLHYHLFKNAGTSLDHILKQNFKDGWHEQEGAGPGWRVEEVTEYLRQHPEIVVLSSHTALLPPPVLPNTTVYPIIFIRHPIDRIRSIYEFERKQVADTEGARMAKETDMAGYIQWRLNRRGDRSIRNFQAYRLAFTISEMHEGQKLSEEQRALKAIQTLPFVGVVQHFDESLAKLQAWLKPVFPHIDFKPTKENVTQKNGMSIEERLTALKEEIAPDVYAHVEKANALDFNVYETVCNGFTGRDKLHGKLAVAHPERISTTRK